MDWDEFDKCWHKHDNTKEFGQFIRQLSDDQLYEAWEQALSLTLADSGGVSESIFHALPDMVRNFYTVSAWPGHEGNLMVPNFAADRCDRVAEGQDRFWIPCGGSRLELLRFIEIVCPECYD